MTPLLQFALTFVTLVVLVVVLYSRLVRFEKLMREEKEGIQRLNERLQSVADALEAVPTARIETRLADIHDVLERTGKAVERRLAAPAVRADPVLPAARSLLDLVEAKLYNLGYGRVAVIGQLAEADTAEPVCVRVEAEKEGVLHKGHLVIHGSAVTELEMQPSYTSFP